MPKKLKIITVPNNILRTISKEIKDNQIADLQKLCTDMALTMIKSDGVGLAAPQIGKNIRLITVNTKEGPVCMFNPKISKRSILQEWGEEGCLSVPEYFGKVKRNKSIYYCYIDENRNTIKKEAKGFMARVIQHEIDHLDGVLFIDKAKNLEKITKD